jgi:hypothetical protein
LTRPGYLGKEHHLSVGTGQIHEVACDLELDPRAPRAILAGLRVLPTESDAQVSVDGRPFAGEPLPIGSHTISVERAGFEAWRGTVDVVAGQTKSVNVRLRPTKAYVSSYVARAERQRYLALGLGISGVVASGAALGTYVWNSGRYDAWVRERDALSSEIDGRPLSKDWFDRNSALQERSVELQRTDAMALGLGAVGVGLAAAGAVLWFDAPDPRKYGGLGARVGVSDVDVHFSW